MAHSRCINKLFCLPCSKCVLSYPLVSVVHDCDHSPSPLIYTSKQNKSQSAGHWLWFVFKRSYQSRGQSAFHWALLAGSVVYLDWPMYWVLQVQTQKVWSHFTNLFKEDMLFCHSVTATWLSEWHCTAFPTFCSLLGYAQWPPVIDEWARGEEIYPQVTARSWWWMAP